MDSIGLETVGPEKGPVAERFCLALHPHTQTAVQTRYRDLEKCATGCENPRSIPDPGAANRRESGSRFFRTAWAVSGQISHRRGASKSQPGFLHPPCALEESASFSRYP